MAAIASRTPRVPQRLTMAHGAMVTAALITFVSVGSVLRDRGATMPIAVLAAAADQGTAAEDLTFRMIEVPIDSPLADRLADPAALPAGSVLASDLEAGDPVVASILVSAGSSELSRTVTLPVDAVVIDGLRLQVGDLVDVVGANTEDRIVYLASGLRIAALPAGGAGESLLGAPSDSFVTVEVSDAEALIILDGGRRGPLDLVRSSGVTQPALGLEVGP